MTKRDSARIAGVLLLIAAACLLAELLAVGWVILGFALLALLVQWERRR